MIFSRGVCIDALTGSRVGVMGHGNLLKTGKARHRAGQTAYCSASLDVRPLPLAFDVFETEVLWLCLPAAAC